MCVCVCVWLQGFSSSFCLHFFVELLFERILMTIDFRVLSVVSQQRQCKCQIVFDFRSGIIVQVVSLGIVLGQKVLNALLDLYEDPHCHRDQEPSMMGHLKGFLGLGFRV